MNDQYLIFSVNVLMYLSLFLFVVLKLRSLTITTLISFIYLLLSICSFILKFSTYKYAIIDNTLMPFVYLFMMICITLLPLYIYDKQRANFIIMKDPKLLNILCLIAMCFPILRFVDSYEHLSSGLTLLLTDEEGGLSLYQNNLSRIGVISGTFSFISIFSNMFSDLIPFLFVYLFSLKNGNRFITIMLLLSSIVLPLSAISSGQRTAVIFSVFSFTAAVVLFYRYNNVYKRKVIKAVYLLFSLPILFGVIILSLSRFGSFGLVDSMINYLGQGFINFNTHAFWLNDTREGTRTMTLITSFWDANSPRNYLQRIQHYNKIPINESTFSTFVGDLIIDNGLILTSISLVSFSLIAAFYLRHGFSRDSIDFSSVLIAYFIAILLLQGSFYLFPFSDYGGNLKVILFFGVILLFKINIKNKKNV